MVGIDFDAPIAEDGPMQDVKLDRKLIVETALQIMMTDGIDGLSMRKLGARLNVRAPTLYWYFPDRASILHEVIQSSLIETIQRVAPATTWQQWLQSFGRELWATNRKLPFVTILLQSSELNDQELFGTAVRLLETNLQKFGVDRQIYLRAHSDIQALVLGWAVYLQAGVVDRVQEIFDVDTAVIEAIDGIVTTWERRATVIAAPG